MISSVDPSSGSTHSETPVTKDSDRARLTRINAAIRAASRDLRERHGFLRHQDAIGFGILAASAVSTAAAGAAYASGWLPGWAVIVTVALFTSVAHDIEHDLIHQLYFR
jgi:hypothetical protein